MLVRFFYSGSETVQTWNRFQFLFQDNSQSWPESHGIWVPIPSLYTHFTPHILRPIPKPICQPESQFWFKFRNDPGINFGSRFNSGTTIHPSLEIDFDTALSYNLIPIQRQFRVPNRESRCFGSKTREPGTSAFTLSLSAILYTYHKEKIS